ncbi:MAG TPA: thioredoxin domain-containing protein, partial [Propionibacteriaceae bacterium]|nr:thioredoxin domain-containing protein [Propionibacteriaceae bacterium]
PHLEKLAAEHAGELKIVKVNVDENQILSRRFNAQSIPLLVLLKGGKEVGRQLGAQPLPRLRAWVTPHLG